MDNSPLRSALPASAHSESSEGLRHARAESDRAARGDEPIEEETRNDVDTVSVTDTDATLKPLAQYVRDRKIHAFVVIRNDTIVYERYRLQTLRALELHSLPEWARKRN
jgi:hypothetical protein